MEAAYSREKQGLAGGSQPANGGRPLDGAAARGIARWRRLTLGGGRAEYFRDEIRYGGKWPFANSGTLQDMLTSEGC